MFGDSRVKMHVQFSLVRPVCCAVLLLLEAEYGDPSELSTPVANPQLLPGRMCLKVTLRDAASGAALDSCLLPAFSTACQ